MNKRFFSLALPLAFVCLSYANDLSAQTYTWAGVAVSPATTADYNTATNWTGTGTPPPDTNTETAAFGAATGLSNPNLSAATTVQGVTFNNVATPSYTLSGSTLTIDTNSSTQGTALTQTSANPETITAPLILEDSAANENVAITGTGTGSLTLSGGVTFISNAHATGTSATENLVFTGSTSVTISGAVVLTGEVTTSGSQDQLNFAGAGTTDTFSPTSGVNALVRATNTGTLDVTTDFGLGTGNSGAILQIGSSGGTNGVSGGIALLTGSTLTTFTPVVKLGPSGITAGTVTFGSNVSGTSSITASAGIQLISGAYTGVLSAASGNTLRETGFVSGGGSTNTLQIAGGGGTVVFAAATGNTYASPTTVTSTGILQVTNTSGSATGTAAVAVSGGGMLTGTGFVTGLVTASAGTSVITPGSLTATGTLTLSGGLTAASGATFNHVLTGSTASLLSLGTGAFAQGGTLTFNLTNPGGASLLTGTPYTLISGTGPWSGTPTLAFSVPAGYRLDTSYNGTGYFDNETADTITVQLIAAVPEPGSMALLALGAAVPLLALYKRRARLG